MTLPVFIHSVKVTCNSHYEPFYARVCKANSELSESFKLIVGLIWEPVKDKKVTFTLCRRFLPNQFFPKSKNTNWLMFLNESEWVLKVKKNRFLEKQADLHHSMAFRFNDYS